LTLQNQKKKFLFFTIIRTGSSTFAVSRNLSIDPAFLNFFQVKADHVFSINNKDIAQGGEISSMSTLAWHVCCYLLVKRRPVP
jgi:hypothetical protein